MPYRVFGPVPSRRLGRSLGINALPPKTCDYACVYCQLGRTTHMTVERQGFYDVGELMNEVERAVRAALSQDERIDYLTFVPDGEPTLDRDLGEMIGRVRDFGIPVAVITNGSLLWRDDVREDLSAADLVSVKIDAVDPVVWKRVDRPHRSLSLEAVLEGLRDFSRDFGGTLLTETMLVSGVNDGEAHLKELASFVGGLSAHASYLSIPTRPPAEPWVVPPGEDVLARAYALFSSVVPHVEYLIGYEGDAFSRTGDVREDLLSITAVHPMRRGALTAFLAEANAGWDVVESMLRSRELVELPYGGETFFLRALPGR